MLSLPEPPTVTIITMVVGSFAVAHKMSQFLNLDVLSLYIIQKKEIIDGKSWRVLFVFSLKERKLPCVIF